MHLESFFTRQLQACGYFQFSRITLQQKIIVEQNEKIEVFSKGSSMRECYLIPFQTTTPGKTNQFQYIYNIRSCLRSEGRSIRILGQKNAVGNQKNAVCIQRHWPSQTTICIRRRLLYEVAIQLHLQTYYIMAGLRDEFHSCDRDTVPTL